MSKWQPIETAPKDGTLVLIYVRRMTVHGRFPRPPYRIARWTNGKWQLVVVQNRTMTDNFQPSHWMLLPEPPEFA